jgi:hypothetical protein
MGQSPIENVNLGDLYQKIKTQVATGKKSLKSSILFHRVSVPSSKTVTSLQLNFRFILTGKFLEYKNILSRLLRIKCFST